MNPMFSIIIPIFKVELYLRACIDSVLAQTYRNFELILVDDGSPDNSGNICDIYAEKDNRIRVIHKTNGGLSDARNAGLDIAKGKYIYFLDSDDIISPHLLETALLYMEKGYELTAFSLRGFYDNGTLQYPWIRRCGSFILESKQARKNFIHSSIVQAEIGWEACTRIFIRDIIEKYHLRFADNRKIFAEDMYFSLCYCAHISKIVSLSDCLYYYRQRDDSIMGQQTGKNNVSRIEKLVQEVLKHYQQSDDCDLLVDDFGFLHFQILMNQFVFQIQYTSNPEKYRDDVISSLENWPDLQRLIYQCIENRCKLRKFYSPLKSFEIIQNAKFLLGGSVQMVRFSNWLVQRIKNQKERLEKIISLCQ